MIKRKTKKIKEKPKFHCIYCDEVFEAQRRQAVYCSNTCRQYYYYFRCQFPGQRAVDRGGAYAYAMAFQPVYLENNYSIQLHKTFAEGNGFDVREFISAERELKELEKLLKNKF
jgi:hypothetical protein